MIVVLAGIRWGVDCRYTSYDRETKELTINCPSVKSTSWRLLSFYECYHISRKVSGPKVDGVHQCTCSMHCLCKTECVFVEFRAVSIEFTNLFEVLCSSLACQCIHVAFQIAMATTVTPSVEILTKFKDVRDHAHFWLYCWMQMPKETHTSD